MKKTLSTVCWILSLIVIIQSCKKGQKNVNCSKALYSEITSSGLQVVGDSAVPRGATVHTGLQIQIEMQGTALAALDSTERTSKWWYCPNRFHNCKRCIQQWKHKLPYAVIKRAFQMAMQVTVGFG